jgi:hypothetical protein
MLLLAGTLIVVLQSAQVIYVGVDSKVIAISTSVSSAAMQPKVHQLNGVVFAHAGIFKDLHGKLDAIAAANEAIVAGGDLDAIVERFRARVQPQLRAVLPEIKAENPTYFDAKMKQPLAMLFASVRDGMPRTAAITFDLIPSSMDLTARVVRCPGDCDSQVTNTMSLGEHDAADRFLDSYSKADLVNDPVRAIRQTIEFQANATPEVVSLPATVLQLSASCIYTVP